MMTVYERLKASQINLPEIPPPAVDGYVPSFVPFVRTGNVIYLSGRLARKAGKPFFGKLGQSLCISRVDDFLNDQDTLTIADLTNRKTSEADHNARKLSEILTRFRTARLRLLDHVEDCRLAFLTTASSIPV